MAVAAGSAGGRDARSRIASAARVSWPESRRLLSGPASLCPPCRASSPCLVLPPTRSGCLLRGTAAILPVGPHALWFGLLWCAWDDWLPTPGPPPRALVPGLATVSTPACRPPPIFAGVALACATLVALCARRLARAFFARPPFGSGGVSGLCRRGAPCNLLRVVLVRSGQCAPFSSRPLGVLVPSSLVPCVAVAAGRAGRQIPPPAAAARFLEGAIQPIGAGGWPLSGDCPRFFPRCPVRAAATLVDACCGQCSPPACTAGGRLGTPIPYNRAAAAALFDRHDPHDMRGQDQEAKRPAEPSAPSRGAVGGGGRRPPRPLPMRVLLPAPTTTTGKTIAR